MPAIEKTVILTPQRLSSQENPTVKKPNVRNKGTIGGKAQSTGCQAPLYARGCVLIGVNRFQSTGADVGINFRRYNARVAEQQLNDSQVGAVLSSMWVAALYLKACGFTRFL